VPVTSQQLDMLDAWGGPAGDATGPALHLNVAPHTRAAASGERGVGSTVAAARSKRGKV
jgi:hypothetical protein